jgi:glycosyltransferase involved in cell wall biosynthesis
MPNLTQCLIVKNEEQNLPKALSWGKALMSEQIVIDTGSEDNTVALAHQLGAKVLHFDWVDDFSAARNFAITQCSGDWIFFLDADEYFEEQDLPLLTELINEAEFQGCNVIETPWINVRDNSISTQARMFRNVPHLRYEGKLHEQLHALEGGFLKVLSVKEKPAIYHTGYVWNDSNSKMAKGARNFKIAQKALETAPGSAKLNLFAADALMLQGNGIDAQRYYSKALTSSDDSMPRERTREAYKQWIKALFQIQKSNPEGLDYMETALRAHADASSHFPDDPDFDVLLSLLFFREKDLGGAIRFFSASLNKNGGTLSESLKASHGEIFDKLRELCEKLKEMNAI